ncbi:MAG: hypothetical protein HC829_02370 [Bacteroidales bacterium]|nr:hypothetical protein [Bacteroidales bacterium]
MPAAPGGEAGRFALEQCGPDWLVRADGAEFARAPLREAMHLVDWELARRAVKQDSPCAAFHAAWVAREDHAILFAGDGGSGKSGLCLKAMARGFRCGAEDVTFLAGDRLVPFPRAIQLRRDDPLLDAIDPARRFEGCDGRVCVEVRPDEAAPEMASEQMTVVVLDPAASGPPRVLSPLEGLQRLFGLCHRLDRATQPLFDTFTALAATGRIVVSTPDAALSLLDLPGARP